MIKKLTSIFALDHLGTSTTMLQTVLFSGMGYKGMSWKGEMQVSPFSASKKKEVLVALQDTR